MKENLLSKKDIVHFEIDLAYLAGKIEDNYLEAGQKLNFNFTPVNEAIQALVYFKKKGIDSKLQIKELMQHNAKLKIDIELV
jgi:hypothetical protein